MITFLFYSPERLLAFLTSVMRCFQICKLHIWKTMNLWKQLCSDFELKIQGPFQWRSQTPNLGWTRERKISLNFCHSSILSDFSLFFLMFFLNLVPPGGWATLPHLGRPWIHCWGLPKGMGWDVKHVNYFFYVTYIVCLSSFTVKYVTFLFSRRYLCLPTVIDLSCKF